MTWMFEDGRFFFFFAADLPAPANAKKGYNIPHGATVNSARCSQVLSPTLKIRSSRAVTPAPLP